MAGREKTPGKPPLDPLSETRSWRSWFSKIGEQYVRTWQVTYNPASIAGGVATDMAITVSGVSVKDIVTVEPPSLSAGLLLCGWWVTADTVTVRLYNYTGGAVDQGSGTWKFLATRL